MRASGAGSDGGSGLDERLLAYLYCFNVTKNYYDCHEYLESLWLDSGREAVQQGLIQAAVCLYHLYNGNIRGATRMWDRGRPRLIAVGKSWQGIDIHDLVAQMDAVFTRLPVAWSTQTMPPAAVEALQLPSVIIQFTDSTLTRRVEQLLLPPLPRD